MDEVSESARAITYTNLVSDDDQQKGFLDEKIENSNVDTPGGDETLEIIKDEQGSGTQNVGSDSEETVTISFSNAYLEASGSASIKLSSNENLTDLPPNSGGFDGFTTNGNGNIDGMEIVIQNGGSVTLDFDYSWNVSGVRA